MQTCHRGCFYADTIGRLWPSRTCRTVTSLLPCCRWRRTAAPASGARQMAGALLPQRALCAPSLALRDPAYHQTSSSARAPHRCHATSFARATPAPWLCWTPSTSVLSPRPPLIRTGSLPAPLDMMRYAPTDRFFTHLVGLGSASGGSSRRGSTTMDGWPRGYRCTASQRMRAYLLGWWRGKRARRLRQGVRRGRSGNGGRVCAGPQRAWRSPPEERWWLSFMKSTSPCTAPGICVPCCTSGYRRP
mmetsp:Transcript_13742/g.39088  ORF Transcript_13742/g.39088 Transcript_13742/m.39088 type:complete len:246 (-) Transcript_13742:2160-2897(-)